MANDSEAFESLHPVHQEMAEKIGEGKTPPLTGAEVFEEGAKEKYGEHGVEKVKEGQKTTDQAKPKTEDVA